MNRQSETERQPETVTDKQTETTDRQKERERIGYVVW